MLWSVVNLQDLPSLSSPCYRYFCFPTNLLLSLNRDNHFTWLSIFAMYYNCLYLAFSLLPFALSFLLYSSLFSPLFSVISVVTCVLNCMQTVTYIFSLSYTVIINGELRLGCSGLSAHPKSQRSWDRCSLVYTQWCGQSTVLIDFDQQEGRWNASFASKWL